jgi:hypothetical protein
MGAIESMPGNVLIDNADYPDGVNTVIGSAKWIENNSIVYFVFNDQNNHSIWTYKLDTKEIKKVISNLTITINIPPAPPVVINTYAGEALNFKVENKIYHANVIDNLLYWTDGFNPPRKLDLNMAIKFIESNGSSEDGYSLAAFSSVEESSKTMDVLKAPPTVIIEAEYETDPNRNFNKLYGNQYQFRYQYVYENNEESKWSMISKQPFPPSQDFISGRDVRDSLKYNTIKLIYYTGSVNVRQINFAYRRGENGAWLIFKQLDKIQENVVSYEIKELIFDDNIAPQGATLTDILYDNVPQTSQCQEILSNQSLAYANFYADYDLVSNINIECNRVLHELFDANTSILQPINIQTWNASAEDLFPTSYIQINYNYEYLSSGWEKLSDQTPLFNFLEGDVITIPLYNYNSSISSLTNYYYTLTYNDVYNDPLNPISNEQLISNLILSMVDKLQIDYPEVPWVASDYEGLYIAISIYGYAGELWGGQPGANKTSYCKLLRKNRASKSLKKGSKKVFGIQYYDRGNRSNTVQTTPEMILEVPLPGQEDRSSFQYNIDPQGYWGSLSGYTVSSKLTINHTPPDWATHYSILVKKDELIGSFMQTSVTSISYEPSKPFLLRVQLDKQPFSSNVDYYTSEYFGATFYHTPAKGDKIRFITGETVKIIYPFDENPSEDPNARILPNPYSAEYIELDVMEYDASTNSILVNDFDFRKLLGNASAAVGSLVEIYTPKKDVIEDVWYEIEKFDIINNSGFRYHAGNTQNQTIDQPAIIDSDYGDVYYRLRDLASGLSLIEYNTFSNLSNDPVSKYGNVLSYAQDEEKLYYYDGFNYRILLENLVQNQQVKQLPDFFSSRCYFIEDFNYTDYYVSDGHGRGRIGIENNKTRRTHYKTGVIHSAQYVMGAFINGLSSFDTLGNAEYLDDTFGPINRLKQVGYTLKALQDRKEVSIYVQRSYATSGDGSGQLAYASKTFGGVNPSETLYGCTHPGSVLLIENDMYYYDYNSGTVVRSSANGQYDLTGPKYKFNYWLTNQTGLVGKVEEKNILGEPYYSKYEPIAFVDEQNTEYTLNFVKYFYPVDKPAQVLGNKIYYQYDSNIAPVFDYLEDRWKTFVDYDLYWAETLGINVFTFNQENLYEHNIAALEDGTPNELTFYGEQKTMSVDFVMNDQPIFIKRPLSIGLRSNKLFDLTEVSTKATSSYPAMKSKLFPNNFKLKEGYWWAAYLRDMTNIIAAKPSQNTEEKALINGRELRAFALLHKIEYSGNEKAILFDVKCSYVLSEAFI